MRHRRFQSQTERDATGFAARQERDATPIAIDDDDVTGRYEGEELDEMRERRPPLDRIGHLEKKHDALSVQVTETRVTLGELKGSIGTLLKFGAAAEEERAARHKREADEQEKRRKFLPILIGTLGTAIAAVVAAAIHGCG